MSEVRLARRKPITKERLLANMKETPGPLDTNCWIWRRQKNKVSGYGIIEITDDNNKRRAIQAHRASYKLWNGEIIDGLEVLHRCDVRGCINPNHLFLGTQTDNMIDCVEKKRHSFGERNGLSKLDDNKVLVIRSLLESNKLTITEIAKQFDVDITTIHKIYQGKSWKHLGAITWPVRDLTNRLTFEKVSEIKSLLSKGLSQIEIAKVFGIDQTTVSDIKRGKRWKRLQIDPQEGITR